MFKSLHSRLIFSYAFIIFLCLLLAGSALFALLRNYQARLTLARLADMAVPISFQVRKLSGEGASSAEIASYLKDQAEEMGIAILLFNERGEVLEDTSGRMRGRKIKLPLEHALWGKRLLRWGRYEPPSTAPLLFAALPAGQTADGARLWVALAAPSKGPLAIWADLAPKLLIAGLVSLLISILVALILSYSIAKPLAQLTHASEEIARGHYDQEIPVRGSDEVARLARSFNRMAREVKRARQRERDFVADISHELKTPLTSVQGFSQALLDGTVEEMEGVRRAAQIIHEEADRMARLVGELLELSKLESGQIELARGPLNLTELLRRCVARFTARAEEAGIRLRVDLPALPLIHGDPDRLERVFSNLLDNAIKFTPEGGKVDLTARKGDEAIEVTVADTGVGIPREDLPHIFERFYRGDRSRRAGGTGLGLAIAREIVIAHGGKIEVKSEVGRGTRFTVTLPLKPPGSSEA